MTKAAVADAEKRFEKTRKADLDAALKLKAAQAEGDAARNGETPTAVNGAASTSDPTPEQLSAMSPEAYEKVPRDVRKRVYAERDAAWLR